MKIVSCEASAVPTEKQNTGRRHKRGAYQKVYDRSNRPVRGLWQRNGAFYVRVAAADPITGVKTVRRLRIENAETVADATKQVYATREKAAEGALSRVRAPKFSEYLISYFEMSEGKAPATIAKERAILNRWSELIGNVALNKITPVMIRHYMGKRERAGIAGRTINLDLIALRCVLKQALSDGHLRALPTLGIRGYKTDERMRQLITWSEIEEICKAARSVSKNGDQFADYVQLMAFAGSRRSETLRIRWVHVDFDGGFLLMPNEREKEVSPTTGSDENHWRKSQTKNRKWRVINFNSDLQCLLKQMWERRAPDSSWLFPSPQRGERDIPAKTFTETLKLARRKTGNERFNFHDLRHYFVSMCVMAGVDYMTIARWVGHRDGGVLIGKVYGHLGDTHARNQALRVSLVQRPPSEE